MLGRITSIRISIRFRRPTNRISDRRAHRAEAHLKRIRNNARRCGIGYKLVEQLQSFYGPSITGRGGRSFGDRPQATLSGRAPEQFNSIGRCFRVVLFLLPKTPQPS
jgi:hypothetical protein